MVLSVGILQQFFEIRNGLFQSLLQREMRLPAEQLPGEGDVRFALDWIIAGQGMEIQSGSGTGKFNDFFSEIKDGKFKRVAEIDRAGDVVS